MVLMFLNCCINKILNHGEFSFLSFIDWFFSLCEILICLIRDLISDFWGSFYVFEAFQSEAAPLSSGCFIKLLLLWFSPMTQFWGPVGAAGSVSRAERKKPHGVVRKERSCDVKLLNYRRIYIRMKFMSFLLQVLLCRTGTVQVLLSAAAHFSKINQKWTTIIWIIKPVEGKTGVNFSVIFFSC